MIKTAPYRLTASVTTDSTAAGAGNKSVVPGRAFYISNPTTGTIVVSVTSSQGGITIFAGSNSPCTFVAASSSQVWFNASSTGQFVLAFVE